MSIEEVERSSETTNGVETDQHQNKCRALAFPKFRPPPPKQVEQAGHYHEAQEIRTRIILGQDDGKWLPNDLLRRLRFEESGDEEDDISEIDEIDEKEDQSVYDIEDAVYEKYLMKLDPSEWKEQDHYKVLGLSKLRYKATPDQIRTAFRKKVLRHHPDKRRHRGIAVKDESEDYYTCITRAHETLSHRTQRRAYDSVDPLFSDSIPPLLKGEDRKDFFKQYEPVFRRNARWSTVQPVPKLGDEQSDYEFVNDFYSFWFEFTTWREYSYLDEEDKEKGENRYERRYIERENKVERDRRRKEEIKRIRTLVENAYNSDPRIARFKEEEKAKKEAEKQAKLDASRKKKEEEKWLREEAARKERERKEAAEMEAKKKREEEKKEKDKKRKAFQKQKKVLQNLCKESNYFTTSESEVVQRMEDVNRLCTLLAPERLEQLNIELADAEQERKLAVFQNYVEELERTLEEERLKNAKLAGGGGKKANQENGESTNWTEEELNLLVKAASSLFPVGTKDRYAVIAAFINEHKKEGTTTRPKTAKDVISKAKNLKNVESTSKDLPLNSNSIVLNKKATVVQAAPTERVEVAAGDSEEVQWSAEEQKRLEQALRSIPASTPERWERIADCIPGKNKKDCIKRYKELAELVRAKKAAQQKVAKS